MTLSGISSVLIGFSLTLTLLLAPAAASLAAVNCAPITTSEVEALFDRWNEALQSGDPDRVSALYSDSALLLPTLSPIARTDHTGIRNYFVDFLGRGPQGRIESRTVDLGCNEAVDAGTYSFRFRDGERVQARYTFVYRYSNEEGHWLIQHHHSSVQPAA